MALFTRAPNNPILTRDHWPYPVNTVFNAGATTFEGNTLLLVRCEDHTGYSHMTKAISKNGVDHWDISETPSITADPNLGEDFGAEDCRITYMAEENTYYIVYCAYSKSGPLVSCASTQDFETYTKHGILFPPENKDAALLPEKINGHYVMIHRPVAGAFGKANMWISFSPDLVHWGKHQLLMGPGPEATWEQGKIGLSTPPLKTDTGWLITYHAVKGTVSGCLYRVGLALLDLEDPTKVIARVPHYVFTPEAPYELAGDVPGVTFPCGWTVDGDTLNLYYGAADTCTALAQAKLPEVLDLLDQHRL